MNNETVNISRESYDELRKKERQLKKLRVKVREGFKYFTLIKDGDEKETWYTNDEEIKHLVGQLKSAKEEVKTMEYDREISCQRIFSLNEALTGKESLMKSLKKQLEKAKEEVKNLSKSVERKDAYIKDLYDRDGDHEKELKKHEDRIFKERDEKFEWQDKYEKESRKSSRLSYYLIIAVSIGIASAIALGKLMSLQP